MTLFKLDFDPKKKGRKIKVYSKYIKINQLIIGTFKKQKKGQTMRLYLKKEMLRF